MDKQILELNTYVILKLAPSKIHGVGLFAICDLEKGQKIYADMIPKIYTLPYFDFSKLRAEVSELLLSQFPTIVKGSHFAYPTVRFQAYLNHSDNPNYDAVNDVVLKKIKAGEEITEDYRKIDGYKEVYKWLDNE